MSSLPSGTVTVLFTDTEGSTKLAQEYPEEMSILLRRHYEILNQAIQTHNGFVFRIVGDSFSAAFHTANDTLNAALDAHRKLQDESWSPASINCGWESTQARRN
jgi:class 3 adenylate cyclase